MEEKGLPEGFSFKMESEEYTNELKISVTLPRNSWFAIAFGKGMLNIDMVRFEAPKDIDPSL